jgi:endonuclease/exonuclease/phosphatase family metal-dependent hydrolase
MKIITWNLQWASPSSKQGRLIREQIQQLGHEVICYTEVDRTFLSGGHVLEASGDYGYPHNGERRKVVLWSKNPWTDVDTLGDPDLPSGRFVTGITQGIRFVGVCIPWKDAHVRNGRRDREPWEDHLAYCEGLGRLLRKFVMGKEPICMLGDFNQRIPRKYQPDNVAKALLDALPEQFHILTEGMKDAEGKNLIDHIAVSESMDAEVTSIIPRFVPDGTVLSDHVGVVAKLG